MGYQIWLLFLFSLLGCTPSERGADEDTTWLDVGVDKGASLEEIEDASGVPSPPTFEALGAWLDEQVTDEVIHGYGVMVFDAEDSTLLERSAGRCALDGPCPRGGADYTVDLVTGAASSSKWVVSTLLLAALEDAVDAGRLPSLMAGLDAPISSLLDCAAGASPLADEITLRHLLSFTSGLLIDHPCVGGEGGAVECACRIIADSAERLVDDPQEGNPRRVAHTPGAVYKYSETDLLVAVAIVEQQIGAPWTDYFAIRIAEPAGMGAVAFRDPMAPSGSLRASVRQYAAFVRALFHDLDGASVLLSVEALAAQQANQMPPGVVRLITPQPDLDYGLNNWRWCYEEVDAGVLEDASQIRPDSSCEAVHQTGHAGKGGFLPWIDLTHDRYGVYAMREASSSDSPEDYSPEEVAMTAIVRLYSGIAIP
ncbi:beta-lactamase family protein [Myxococcota bacterium]|nr:beta-lactamase family protein [Myxococcota bacterium]